MPEQITNDVQLVQISKTLTSSVNLIYEETFEGNGPFFYPGSIQTSTDYGFSTVNDVVYQGDGSGRFELRDSDPMIASGTRAEAKYATSGNANRWYSYSVYIPSETYKYDSKAEIISQWHQRGGTNPPISLITRYDNLYLEVRSSFYKKELYEIGPIKKDKWRTFVFHIIHKNNSNGLIEMWINGSKEFTHTGKNSYDYSLIDNPVWKVGLYKWDWNGSGRTDVRKRVIYFDNVRMGDENATYDDMVVSASKNLNPPGTIKSFTLVDARHERDLITISDGDEISLKDLGTSKLNIRANPGDPFRSVRFRLTGPSSRISKDSNEPFTLMGDKGNNYYFGPWDPPRTGTYKLTATPYAGTDGYGLFGIPKTITFTFTK